MERAAHESVATSTAVYRDKTLSFELMKDKILLVDDDPAVRRMLSRLLAQENYLVISASTGREALELADTAAPDLVLLDLNLPGKDGWHTFEVLNTQHPLLPVIIITGRSNQLFPALASGVGALMEKPMDAPKLLSIIADLLKEPADVRLARAAGQRAKFHYLPPAPQRAVENARPA